MSAKYLYQALHKDKVQEADVALPLVIADNELNLGRVYETSAYEHRLRVTNSSDQPVTIIRFEKSCDCLGITPSAGVTLQPHETKTFDIKLRLASQLSSPNHWGGEPLRVSLSAVYSVQGHGQYSMHWLLNCLVVPTIRLSRSTIHLGTLSARQPLIEQSLDIEASDEVRWIDCESPRDWAVEIVPNQARSSPNKFRAILRSHGKLIPRPVSDTLRLTPVSRAGERLPAKELRLVGEIVRDVIAYPREIHHGRQPCGTAATEALQLRSLTNQRFMVKAATSNSGDLEVTRMLGEDEIYTLRLRFTKTGPQEVAAEFTIEHDDGMEYRLVVPVRYHGLAGP
ncbi:MAG TPA: DUF1573 domain-containing protein [Gemmataceae bacterium]|nr:DUF1573 domain-containing protein [Gemmataceae bacterium]